MFTDGHFFSISATRMVGECEKWPISGVTDGRDWIEIYSEKRGMVRAGGSGGRGGGVRKDARRLGRGRWGMSSDLTGLQMNRLFRHWGPLHKGLQTA